MGSIVPVASQQLVPDNYLALESDYLHRLDRRSWVDDTLIWQPVKCSIKIFFKLLPLPRNCPYRPFSEPAGLMLSSRSACFLLGIGRHLPSLSPDIGLVS